MEQRRKKWDLVVLQSYQDDRESDRSSYVEFAPKYTELAHAQGARVILYETTPKTQNAEALKQAPEAAPIVAKEKALSVLAKRLGADLVPMSTVSLVCQTKRPDLTLRYVRDAHLNHTMADLTACTFFGVLFERSPVGLKTDTVVDTCFFEDLNKNQDWDGGTISRIFSAVERRELQTIAWEGLQRYQRMAEETILK